jgi:hypothetical protein
MFGNRIAQSVQRLAKGRTTDGSNSSRGEGKNFQFSTSSRPALGSTELPIHWVLRAVSPGVKR